MSDPSIVWPEGQAPPDADEGEPDAPNMQQAELIQALEGPVLVDAGAGTGKTFTIARRYLHILEAEDRTPDEILLITFTRNAAEEMRERILHLGDLPPARLRDAPISTFHALANRLLEEHGFDAPAHLGLSGKIPPNIRLVEDEVREAELFRAFLRGYRQAHPEHAPILATLHDPTDLLDLIHQLAAKGIFPTTDGWYRDGREELVGDREAYLDLFADANATDGSKQSDVRDALNSYDDRVHLPSAPTKEEIRGGYGSKQVDETWAKQAFDVDREPLIGFVHDVYTAYLEYALDRNYVNFQFLLLFAYVLLVEDDALRERLQYEHVMIDEFQDTSEIQLQLALLFCAEPNLCCVGDWKQSIYSFQYASVDNIRRFQERVARYAGRLNEDRARVPPANVLADPHPIPLKVNYRSTQAILDVAKEALVTPATKGEELDEAAIRADIVELESTAKLETSRVEALHAEDEVDAVLAKIEAIVGDDAYPLLDEDAPDGEVLERAPTYSDVAVLTRTRSFALELQERAREIGLPIAFEGGVEVYKTDAGKLLLAWLRILEDARSDRGWALVLDAAGYTLDEARHVLSEGPIPDEMWAFRQRLVELAREASLAAVARAVFDRYGLHDGFTEALIAAVQDAYDATSKTPGEVVRFLEDKLEAGATEQIDDHAGGDVVTVQTIHAAKGLEYPIVILADLNEARFPSTGGGYPSTIRFTPPVGLRSTKRFAEPEGHPSYVYDDWHATVLRAPLSSTNYDEERRLLYVAMSRAKQHLVLTATTGRASRFFQDLPIEATRVHPELAPAEPSLAERPPPVPVEPSATSTPRGLPIGELVPEPDIQATGGRGRRFGQRVHTFAARYALGDPVEATNEHARHAAAMIDELAATSQVDAEVACTLPLEVDGERVVLEGKIDLLAIDEEAGRVDVVDWKTTPSGEGLNAYRRQVALYAAIAERAYPDADVRGWVVYTDDGRRETVEPLDDATLRALVDETMADDGADREPTQTTNR